jgi:hypothetical protein
VRVIEQRLVRRVPPLRWITFMAHLVQNRPRVAHERRRRVHIWLSEDAQMAFVPFLSNVLVRVGRKARHGVRVRRVCGAGGGAQAAQVRVQPLEGGEEL